MAWLVGAVLALTGCAAATTGFRGATIPMSRALDAAQQRGRDVAVRRCSACHTIGLDDGGATEGPAFRTLVRRYDPISLERRFTEVSAHGFDHMPPVQFSRSELEDLIAYFDSLRAPEAGP